jgi:hypothetical protein
MIRKSSIEAHMSAEAFYLQLSKSTSLWTKHAAALLTEGEISERTAENPEAALRLQKLLRGSPEIRTDLEAVLYECFSGLAHSMLASIDGASQMADTAKIHLVDSDGEPISDALHEEFMAFLVANGKLDRP